MVTHLAAHPRDCWPGGTLPLYSQTRKTIVHQAPAVFAARYLIPNVATETAGLERTCDRPRLPCYWCLTTCQPIKPAVSFVAGTDYCRVAWSQLLKIQYSTVVVVFFTLTDRASTIPSNIRGCQSGTWSQRRTKVNGSHHGDNLHSDQQGSKSRQKVMRLYKRWHRPITKRYIEPHLLHIESSLDRLGLVSPTHGQRYQQQIGQIRSNQF